MSIIEKAAKRMDKQRDAEAANVAASSDLPLEFPAELPASAATEPSASMSGAPAAAPVASAAPAAPAAPQAVHSAAAAAVVTPAAPAARSGKTTTKHIEIDLARMRSMGMVTAAGGRTTLVEDFRIIKRPLLKRAFGETAPGDKPGNLIMITSSLPGEGKTYCAINLAMSIAMELDHTVLLIDADVARPSIMRTLGLPNQRGLMDMLLDENTELADVMLKTNVPTLSILPAGTANARATELLSSQMMTSFVYEIANRYPDRIVIFDSPPLLLTSEAHVLASHMGQIVVVVEAEKTTQHAVKESLRQLEGLNNVNLIYNKTKEFPGVEETYDYHYG